MPYKNNYTFKLISEVNPDIDYKVKIIGLVVDKTDTSIIVDDGKSKVKVFVEPDQIESIEIHQLIAVFGSTIPSDDGFEMKADVIQDLNGLNLNLYKKVHELYKKLGV
ncbi:MAG: hypothetical protein QXM68_02340 [Candidatus Aenigmatarchaeota archaeon]|nr:hypothetical protein [Candidatus Aenigmarchaeota archaeon]